MANFPCSSPPSTCEQQPNPATTYSAEGEDSTTFISEKWAPDPPLLNKAFNVFPCAAFAESQTSQAEADQLATNAALACANPCSPTFTNTAQTANFICSNGQVCSFTYPAGVFNALDQLSADRLAFTEATKVVTAHPVCPGMLVGGMMCLGAFFSASVLVEGDGQPFTFEIISGSPPPGIVMENNGSSVAFSGVPTSTGVYTFAFRVSNTFGVISTQVATINVVSITTTSPLPPASEGDPYSVTLELVDASSDPITWSIIDGALPDGLTLNAMTGEISGTPTTVEDSAFTVQVSDSTGTCSKDFTISIQSGSDVCADGIASLLPNTYAIDGYFDGMIDNSASDPSAFDLWDGTFIYFFGDGIPFDGPTGWANGGTFNKFSIEHNKACSAQLSFQDCIDGVPQWTVRVSNIDDGLIWFGRKAGGQTPEGVYDLESGSSPGPATITIVKLPDPSSPEVGNLFCSS